MVWRSIRKFREESKLRSRAAERRSDIYQKLSKVVIAVVVIVVVSPSPEYCHIRPQIVPPRARFFRQRGSSNRSRPQS